MSNRAGDVTPAEAFEALRADPEAALVDVRTSAEWAYVGLPDLRELGADLFCVEWQSYPSGQRNPDFLAQLSTEGVAVDHPVYFLCRSGARSQAAAELATEHGYTAYNVTDGFEGPLGPSSQRSVSGWKNEGLPWRQS